MTIDQELEFLTRGAVDVLPIGGLKKKIEKSRETKQPLKVKLGVDPTGTEIHLGHTVVLQRLKAFQECGHEVVFLIGDYTGMIGDPTGRSATRKMLTHEELMQNAENYKEQVSKILDPEKTFFQYNSTWLGKLSFKDILEMTSQITVAQMLEREDFSNRYKSSEPISLVEFMYPLMQGYDSVALKADVELGGQDQLFNLLIGRVLQKYYGQEPQVIITVPLLEGTDGVKKMSKSYQNSIGIKESSKDIFGKVMSIPDSLMWNYFKLLTQIPLEEFEKLQNEMAEGKNPRDIKLELAFEIVKTFTSQEEAERAKEEFIQVFSQRKEIPLDTKEIMITENISLLKIMMQEKFIETNSQGRRLITQGAVSFNGEKINDIHFEIIPNQAGVLKIGKKNFLKIK